MDMSDLARQQAREEVRTSSTGSTWRVLALVADDVEALVKALQEIKGSTATMAETYRAIADKALQLHDKSSAMAATLVTLPVAHRPREFEPVAGNQYWPMGYDSAVPAGVKTFYRDPAGHEFCICYTDEQVLACVHGKAQRFEPVPTTLYKV